MKTGKMFVSVAGTIIKISLIVLVVILLYKLLIFSYGVGYDIFAGEAIDRAPGINRSIAIADGKSVKEIGDILEDKGLIEHGWMFVFQEMFSDYHGELKPGVYELSSSMSPFEMMEIMASGEESVPNNALENLTSSEEDMDFSEEDIPEEAESATEGEGDKASESEE